MTCKVINKECVADIADAFGAEIHTNLWGPSSVQTIGGCKYYISFTDDHTCYMKIDLLKTKDQALQAYKGFTNWAQTQHGVCIKGLRLDRGGECTSNEFTKFLQSQGTEHHLTTHNMPQPMPTISAPPAPISTPISGQTLVSSMPAKEDSIIEDEGEAPVHEAMVQSQPPMPQQHATAAPQTQRQSTTQAARASTRVSKPSQYIKQLTKGEGSTDGKGKKAVPGFRGWHPNTEHLSTCTDDADTQDFIFSAIPVDDIIFMAIQDAQGDPKTLHEAQSHLDWPQRVAGHGSQDCDATTGQNLDRC
jgi:hypothetical protein